jgi:hypothetical protein
MTREGPFPRGGIRKEHLPQEGCQKMTEIYKNPIFINSVTHKSVRVAPLANYFFARKLNSVLSVGQEFLEAAKFYPVVFTKNAAGEYAAVIILGLLREDNLLVDPKGNWKPGFYIPAFLRRYPFILAGNIGEDNSFAVCVDSAYEGFGKKKGMALFDREGRQTNEFTKVIEFLQNFQLQHEKTKTFVTLLTEYALFKEVTANITTPAGAKIGMGGLFMIDEEALLTLPDEKVLKLFREGYLTWIYAHLYSLSNFRSLAALTDKSVNRASPD